MCSDHIFNTFFWLDNCSTQRGWLTSKFWNIVFTLSHKRRDIWKNVIEYKRCVFIFLQLLSDKFLILRTEWDVIKHVNRSPCKVPVILVKFQRNLNFLHRSFEKILKYQILPMGAELFHAEWRSDRHDAVTFYNFGIAPKNGDALVRKVSSLRLHAKKNSSLVHRHPTLTPNANSNFIKIR